MKYLVVIFILVSFCREPQTFIKTEKNEALLTFFKNELHRSIPENCIVITLLNRSGYSGCERSTVEEFSHLLTDNQQNKLFIISRADNLLQNVVCKLPKVEITLDTLDKLKEYGLDFGADYYFNFQNGKLIDCFEISNTNIDKAKKSKSFTASLHSN